MKNLKKSIKWIYPAQLVVCAAFLYLFCNNSMLRPSPASAQAKEYCIGTLLLANCYLNAFVLYPAFFQRNKTFAYVLSSVFSVLVALAAEFSWLYSDIMGCLLGTFSQKEAHSYYMH